MARIHAPYPLEFRQQMVELVRAGRTADEVAREFKPSAEAIRNWVKQADRDAGRRPDGLSTAERDEFAWLRREVRQLRQERDIWAKAAA
jgi:transposase